MNKIDFDALEWTSPLPGIRFKVWSDSGRQMRLLEIEESFVEPDWCLKAHLGYVLDGTLEVDFQGRIETFATGDGLVIEAGEAHKARSVGSAVQLVLFEPLP